MQRRSIDLLCCLISGLSVFSALPSYANDGTEAQRVRGVAAYAAPQATNLRYGLRWFGSRNRPFDVIRRTRGGFGGLRRDRNDLLGPMRRYARVSRNLPANQQGEGSPTLGRKQRLFVYGDSLATNLFHGMQSYAVRAGFYSVKRHTRGATGLIRDDEFDWYAHTLRYLKTDQPDMLAVAFGGNDRQDIRTGEHQIQRFSPAWWREYRRRVNRYMSTLHRHVSQVYWLGLPVVRSRRMTGDYARFNKLYRELAARNGVIFVDTWRRFQAAGGGYASQGQDIDGHRQELRHDDGIHFNRAGRLVLARLLVRAIRRRNRKQ